MYIQMHMQIPYTHHKSYFLIHITTWMHTHMMKITVMMMVLTMRMVVRALTRTTRYNKAFGDDDDMKTATTVIFCLGDNGSDFSVANVLISIGYTLKTLPVTTVW